MRKYTKRTIKFYDGIADKYIKSNAAVVLKDKIDRFADLLAGNKILDVACGPGHDTDYLTKRGFSCIGIDLSKKMITLARKNFKGKFKLMDFFNLKFKNNTFDGMWCSSILVHVKKSDIPNLLNDSKKVLKLNGILGLITAQKQKRTKDENDIREYVMFEGKEMEGYIKKAGFNILVSETFSHGGKNRIFIIAKRIN